MQEIVPGVYVITRTATNCYLIESSPGELTLIDTGIPGTTGSILDALASLNYQAEQLKHIFITHADIDHAGSLAKLVTLTGARVYSGKESVQYIEAGESPPHTPAPLALIMNRFHQPASVDVVLSDGETIDIAGGILALHTPGHTPDNTSYFLERERILFGADLFFTITGAVTLSPSVLNWDSWVLKNSAIKALEITPQYICPGHGKPVNIVKYPGRIASLRRQLGGVTLVAT